MSSFIKKDKNSSVSSAITNSLTGISVWMSHRHLKLNLSKTGLIIFHSPPADSPHFCFYARVLEVILVSDFSFQPQIQLFSKSSHLHLHKIFLNHLKHQITNSLLLLLLTLTIATPTSLVCPTQVLPLHSL